MWGGLLKFKCLNLHLMWVFFFFFCRRQKKMQQDFFFFLVNGLPNADVMPGGIRHPKLQIYRAPSIHVIHSGCDSLPPLLLLQSNQQHSPQIGADAEDEVTSCCR